MFSFNRRNLTHFAFALVAASTWLSGCGDDEDDGGGDGNGGSSGSSGATTGGSAGSSGATSGGTGGSPSGGSAGSAPTGGTAGSTGGTAGAGGTAGTGGTAGMGGEGMGGEGMGGEGMGGEGMGGEGMGGEGGSTDAMCTTQNLGITLVMANPMQAHDHLPINGMPRMTLLGMINTGAPLTFTLPTEGTNPHNHTLTFTPQQLTTLRNGGAVNMITSAMGGPMMNMHTHTYAIECQP